MCQRYGWRPPPIQPILRVTGIPGDPRLAAVTGAGNVVSNYNGGQYGVFAGFAVVDRLARKPFFYLAGADGIRFQSVPRGLNPQLIVEIPFVCIGSKKPPVKS